MKQMRNPGRVLDVSASGGSGEGLRQHRGANPSTWSGEEVAHVRGGGIGVGWAVCGGYEAMFGSGRSMKGRRNSGLLLATVLLASGCGVRVPPAPVVPPSPVVEGDQLKLPHVEPASVVDATFMPPPPTEPLPRLDGILDSPFMGHPELEERVAYWVERWRRRGVFDLPVSLGRMGYYRPVIESELEARGLPLSLQYLPVIESGYHPTAVSRVGATGLWQLMGPTARSMGLNVNTLVDERRDPFSATPAALGYLEELHERFGSWFLTLAAYNSGPFRVESILRRHAPDAPRDDATYWRIRPHLPAETQDFVPKFIAAARIGEDPLGHGFMVTPAEPLVFEEVAVADATSVDVLARAAGSPQDVIERLNPHLVRGITPRGVPTVIRVPVGQAEGFTRNLEAIPASERVSFVEHRIARGETLSAVAASYGIRLSDLQAANPGLNPRRLRIGQPLTIPRIPSGGSRVAARETTPAPTPAPPSPARVEARGGDGGDRGVAPPVGSVVEPAEIVHRVGSGESLWSISRRYGVGVEDLRGWNGLGTRAVLQIGQRLTVRTGGEAVASAGGSRIHVVRRGDTLGAIARRYGVPSQELARENGLTLRSTIRPGDRLRVPGN